MQHRPTTERLQTNRKRILRRTQYSVKHLLPSAFVASKILRRRPRDSCAGPSCACRPGSEPSSSWPSCASSSSSASWPSSSWPARARARHFGTRQLDDSTPTDKPDRGFTYRRIRHWHCEKSLDRVDLNNCGGLPKAQPTHATLFEDKPGAFFFLGFFAFFAGFFFAGFFFADFFFFAAVCCVRATVVFWICLVTSERTV